MLKAVCLHRPRSRITDRRSSTSATPLVSLELVAARGVHAASGVVNEEECALSTSLVIGDPSLSDARRSRLWLRAGTAR